MSAGEGAQGRMPEALPEIRHSVADTLRAETAQVLALLLIEITTLSRVEDVNLLHGRLGDLRGAVQIELARIRELADALERSA